MWYTLGHEKTHLYPSFDPGRTAVTPGGPAVVQCLCVTPLSALARQCPRPDRPRECRDPGLRRSRRSTMLFMPSILKAWPACDAGPPRRSGPACRLRCPAPRQLRAFLHQSPRTFGHPTSQWTLALAAEMAYAEPHAPPHQWRKHSPRLGMPWRTLEAGQTLDHQSRSGIRSNKKRRDRLMALAATHPTWGWAWVMKSGGVDWRSPHCIPGRLTGRPCVWWNKRGPKPISIRKHWPAMASWCATSPSNPNRCCCACGASPGQHGDNGVSGLVQ